MLKSLARIPLQKLRAGQPANISCVTGNPQDVARFAEMGLRCGTRVCVVRGGNTCILQVEGHRMCVRPSKELAILVTPA
jgi:Fe2+ transport system protein FeoA